MDEGRVAASTGAGHAMVGFSVSMTVTLKVHEAESPDPSVAVAVMLVVPTATLAAAEHATLSGSFTRAANPTHCRQGPVLHSQGSN